MLVSNRAAAYLFCLHVLFKLVLVNIKLWLQLL